MKIVFSCKTVFSCENGKKAAIVILNSDDSYSVIIEDGTEKAVYLGIKSATYAAKFHCNLV